MFCRSAIATVWLALAWAATAAAQTGGSATATAGAGSAGFDGELIRTFIARRMETEGAKAGPIQRVDIKLGALDSRIQLAACAQAEPYVPSGARPWGRTVIGVRCVSGANWNMLMPVTVSIWGTALVATSPIAAGVAVDATQFVPQEVEWSRESTPPVFDSAQLSGRTLVRALQAGQVLRTDMLRATPVLVSGDTVTVRISGAGFTISAQGQALSAAGVGQTVRVRTEHGRMLTGIARAGKTVEVAL